MLAFAFFAWRALGSFSGWPTSAHPPARALFLAASVDEPRWIYLWLVPERDGRPFAHRGSAGEPRAYRLPYTRQLHEQLERAQRARAGGARVDLRREPLRAAGRAPGRFRAYVLPPPQPAAKR